ncbi:MAG TPA: MlaD family protein [Candidatus Omnitrophota bacterium]|nr:MlaD family protein [Candidatus Omnitrophota bacterium]HQL41094.1 MlaD family protein [Candidatus Omnitrophota bacterium]
MEQKEFSRNFYAGLFFLIGVVLICVVVLSIGMDKGIMRSKFKMRVLFSEVGGLVVGAPVRLSGVNVGTVARIDFLSQEFDGRNVEVVLNLYDRYKDQLAASESFQIKTEGMLGQKFVQINKSSEGSRRRIDLNKPVVGEDPLDVQDLAKTFGQTALSLQETAKAIDSMMVEVKDRFKTIKRILNRIEQRLIDGTLFRVF